jgi:hypothetical protein
VLRLAVRPQVAAHPGMIGHLEQEGHVERQQLEVLSIVVDRAHDQAALFRLRLS